VSDLSVPDCGFDAVPLPSFQPDQLWDRQVEAGLRAWVCSPPLQRLADASGWSWPACHETGELVAQLAALSSDWDFRGRTERHLLRVMPAEVNGRILDEELVFAATEALGLVRAAAIPAVHFTHLAVLSGQVAACVNRTGHAASLLSGGLRADSVVVLGAHRELVGREPERARELGLGSLFDEADAVVAATQQAFGLGDPEKSQESGPHLPGWDESLRGASARYSWESTEVVIAPSSEPARRRANTADQLQYWAERAGIGRQGRVLLLTTQIYVPFQQFTALLLLGLERGCSVHCCGVDMTTAVVPIKEFRGHEYLQEVRSALLAAGALLTAAGQAGR
jgi:hypothetical protein